MNNNGVIGLGVAVLTPFTAGGEIDMISLAGHVKFLLAGGVKFLVLCGTTGEAPTLSWAEQERIIACILEITDAKVPVIVGCTSNNTRSLIDAAKKIKGWGIKYLMSASPYYSKPTQEGIYQHFKALKEESDLQVIAYNIPSRTAVEIMPETVQRMTEDGLIFALKETSTDIARVQKICLWNQDRLRIFSGDDALSLPITAVGGQGIISVVANLIPQLMRAWTDSLLANDFLTARKQLKSLLKLFEACFLESSPIPAKAGAEILGLMNSRTRLPLTTATATTQAALKKALSPLVVK